MCVSSRREIVQETFLTNIYAQEEKQLSRSEKNLPQVDTQVVEENQGEILYSGLIKKHAGAQELLFNIFNKM